jgi:hypothetical protein
LFATRLIAHDLRVHVNWLAVFGYHYDARHNDDERSKLSLEYDLSSHQFADQCLGGGIASPIFSDALSNAGGSATPPDASTEPLPDIEEYRR